MEALLSKHPPRFPAALLPSRPLPTCRFGIPPARSSETLCLLSRRRGRNRELAAFCAIAAPSQSTTWTYGGWEDPCLEDDVGAWGSVPPFRGFFVAMGIADGKYAVMFCLGFLSALAVSRVRVWTLAVLPFSGLIFVFGVLLGSARGSLVSELLARIRRSPGSLELSLEDMKSFGELLEELGVKLSELRSRLQGFVDLKVGKSEDMTKYVGILDAVTLESASLRKFIQECTQVDSVSEQMGEDRELEMKSSAKSNRRKKEVGGMGSDILQFLAVTFQDVLIGRNPPPRTRDSGARRESAERVSSGSPSLPAGSGAADGNVSSNGDKQVFPMLSPSNIQEDHKVGALPKESLEDKPESSEIVSGTMRRGSTETERSRRSVVNARSPDLSVESLEDQSRSSRSKSGGYDQDTLLSKEDFSVLNRDFSFMSMQGSYHKVVLQHRGRRTEKGREETRGEGQAESGLDEIVSFSSVEEVKPWIASKIYDRAYSHAASSRMKENMKHRRVSQKIRFRDEPKESETQSIPGAQHSELDPETNKKVASSTTASTAAADGVDFEHVVKRGVDLLRQAGECLKGKNDEKVAEILLYESTSLLSAAVSMKPKNLLALGQLGNTHLLHGELKLKMSRDLRTLLSRTDHTLIGRRHRLQSREQHNQLNKEEVASLLSDVCEECEELLIEAGRNYKIVLSYDKNDVRALYNWGLALSFRAQLIADIGPDAAPDADKVYLAAIEKFDAMLSRSNDYAPDALFRWGMALWERSHLRASKSSEKLRLLRQAKALFEDVLLADSDNPQVQEALDSCTSEINFGRRFIG